MSAIHYQQAISAHLLEKGRMRLCIGFWETRKIKGFAALFFITHNIFCQFKADFYRAKLRKLERR
jgi:hypothetical protein